MYKIVVRFTNSPLEKIFYGNFIIEGSFVRINYDHDENKKTPQHTTVYPVHVIESINSEVIQSGANK